MTTFDAPTAAKLRERIRSRTSIEDRGYKTPCWISNRAGGGKDGRYTKIVVTTAPWVSEIWYTHRLAYAVFVGPIPDGLQIDHRCDQTKCCNPSHLEPVTARENLLRSNGISSNERAQAECIHGHPFDEANTWVDARGRRHCRACKRRRKREAASRQLEGARS